MAVVLLLLIHCLWGFCAWSLFCYTVLSVLSSFEIILMRKIELAAFLYFFPLCIMTVSALWFFLVVPLVGLQGVFVVFPYHTHLPFLFINLIFTYFFINLLLCQTYMYLILENIVDVDKLASDLNPYCFFHNYTPERDK